MKGEIILQGPLIDKIEKKEIKHNRHREVRKQRIQFPSWGLPLDSIPPLITYHQVA